MTPAQLMGADWQPQRNGTLRRSQPALASDVFPRESQVPNHGQSASQKRQKPPGVTVAFCQRASWPQLEFDCDGGPWPPVPTILYHSPAPLSMARERNGCVASTTTSLVLGPEAYPCTAQDRRQDHSFVLAKIHLQADCLGA